MRRQAVLALMSAFYLACDEGSSYLQGPLRLGTAADPAFAVVLRGKSGSAVGLLDASGAVIRDTYVQSKDEVDGARVEDALTIPSNPELDGVLTVLNGKPLESVLRIDYFNGELLAEIPLRLASETQVGVRDYLYLDEKHAWVTRYDPNLDDDDAKSFGLGDDLVLLEPGSGKLVKRLDLSALYEEVSYRDEDGDEVTDTAYARPSRLIGLADGYAYVGLDRLTQDGSGAAPGAGLILDLDKAKVTTLELEGLSRCGEVVPVAGKDDAVIVACSGAGDEALATRGLVYVEIKQGKGAVRHMYRFEEDGSALAALRPISLGGTRVAIALRRDDEDVLAILDLDSEKLVEIGSFAANTLGEAGAYQPEAQQLLLPDHEENRILRFKVDSKGAKADGAFALDSELTVEGVFALKRF